MSERTDSPPASTGGASQSEVNPDTDITARRVLLEEARTATNQQLGQVNKIDTAAVRMVRITFLLLGILVGGSRFPPFPDLATFGALGMWSLVTSLLGSLYVYGTSRLFIGSGPAELGIDYEESSSIERARVEVIRKYEDGIRKNWGTLYVNGFVLAVSRVLLAFAIVFVVVGFAHAM